MRHIKRILYKIHIWNRRPVILWIDHSLGGGTATYSKTQFKKLNRKYDIKRLQYFPHDKTYQLTSVSKFEPTYRTQDINQMYGTCLQYQPSEIVVNNLVGYPSTLRMLQFVNKLKNNILPRPKVSFRGHDFQCICPSYNLINCDGVYCNLSHTNGCEACWANKRLSSDDKAHNILKSGACTIRQWRCAWQDFLENTADEIIVFSQSTKEILTQTYKNILDKIQIIPHTTKKYKRVKIKHHDDINIGVLGQISFAKGADIIHQMSNDLNNHKNVNIIIIGTTYNPNQKLKIHGKYKPYHLPKIIKSYNIDLIFIPSIWPETFSYTTSEAMAMGIPVACYDMGAPAERVANYKYGLVLPNISPSENLGQIIQFIQSIKRH